MSNIPVAYIVVHVICGIISYGLMFHYYQTRFRCFAWPLRNAHRFAGLVAAVSGPLGFLQRWLVGMGDKDQTPWRLQYKAVTPDESWDDYHRRFPGLSRTKWESTKFFRNA